ncbi:MAG: radical SAM protein [Bacteroidales bacterium]|nr:radical SAM protein [Bacteroidales bacterium]
MYRVNEIFYSLQGEGFWTGTPMVFVRLSGCNLQCPFCDTDHRAFKRMSADEILKEVRRLDRKAQRDNPWWDDCGHVCITGGEPLIQLDAPLIEVLHHADYMIHVETNGTLPVPPLVDWVTLSPKEDFVPNAKVVLEEVQEVKLLFDGTLSDESLEYWADFPAKWHFLQPCDVGDPVKSRAILKQTVDYVKSHGAIWRLSLQTHKLLGIR